MGARAVAIVAGLMAFSFPALAQLPTLKGQGAIAQGAADKRRVDRPARDTLWACGFTVMGLSLKRPWLAADGTIYFARKPIVAGSVAWSEARFSARRQGDRLRITGSALPSHPTGSFPIPRDSAAGRYDPNPNSIRGRDIDWVLPANPTLAPQVSCLPMGPIGITVTGAVLFHALDAEGRDAVANEIFDGCEGHPPPGGLYHYHHHGPCLPQAAPGQDSPLVGWALDGFAIYGPYGEGGRKYSNRDLDECHGTIGRVRRMDGSWTTTYHYRANDEFPYTLGCFRGAVDPALLRRDPPPGAPGKGPPPR
ncbi:MAG: YHYH protein [Alphaproteobacteria bacterium]|nr:YHYH protein [Alphaproteobacteria bacterium]MCW5743655.1 YHYH protein [Alphaproteobacteria bacterium]